jgi:hypothetical protein
MVSCKKESLDQTVTFSVKCKHCFVDYEDNLRNSSNSASMSSNNYEHQIVDSSWRYTFVNQSYKLDYPKLDSVSVMISVSDLQQVTASIISSDGKTKTINKMMGTGEREYHQSQVHFGLKLN